MIVTGSINQKNHNMTTSYCIYEHKHAQIGLRKKNIRLHRAAEWPTPSQNPDFFDQPAMVSKNGVK